MIYIYIYIVTFVFNAKNVNLQLLCIALRAINLCSSRYQPLLMAIKAPIPVLVDFNCQNQNK